MEHAGYMDRQTTHMCLKTNYSFEYLER